MIIQLLIFISFNPKLINIMNELVIHYKFYYKLYDLINLFKIIKKKVYNILYYY